MDANTNLSSKASRPPPPWLEASLEALDAKLIASGHTKVEMKPSNTNEYKVTFPPSQRPRSKWGGVEKRDLRAAYLATDFTFEAEGQRYTLRIGEPNPEVRLLLARQSVQGAAFITACNPASLQLGEVHNKLAMRSLRRTLYAHTVFDGAGQDRTGDWPPEPSLMLLGVSQQYAEALGRRYGQYAIVWIDGTGTPSLVELADLDHAVRYPRKNPPFKWIELGVAWGYDYTWIRIKPGIWRQILAGESVGLTTWDYSEGRRFRMSWGFGGGALEVCYGDDGGTAFVGDLADATLQLP
jgi:hypothetical protein